MASIGTAWVDGAWVFEGWAVGAWSTAASAGLTGTVADGLTEAEVVAGGETIIITLIGDTWVGAGATFDAQRQAIIDGLDSDGVEATGWNAEVRDKEVVGAVVRTSDTVVTITLSAAAAYAIDADETITMTVPAAALTGAAEITATPTFDVTAAAAATTEAAGGYYGGTWPPPADERRDRRRAEEWQEKAERADQLRAKLRTIWERGRAGEPPLALEPQPDLQNRAPAAPPPPAPAGLTKSQRRRYNAVANQMRDLLAAIEALARAMQMEQIEAIRDEEAAAALLLLH